MTDMAHPQADRASRPTAQAPTGLGDTATIPCVWRCFHCDDVFHDERSALDHFGPDEGSAPACRIKAGAEGSLVKALRRVEGELADAWHHIHNESTEAAKAYFAQQSRHREQLTAAEELGYERGLRDARAIAMDARSDEMERLGPKGDSAGREASPTPEPVEYRRRELETR